MRRLGAILIPLLTGFLVTVAVVSWRAGWWQQRNALQASLAAPPRVEVRPPSLRIVQVNVAEARARTASTAAPPAPAAPKPLPEPALQTWQAPPVPRVDPGNSPELLGAPERKFAHGADSSGE